MRCGWKSSYDEGNRFCQYEVGECCLNNMYAVFEQFGPPQQVVKLGQKIASPPQAQQITVRMLARPINPSDLIPIRGAYAHRTRLPCIPGYEGVGIVEAVGADADPKLLGQRVLPLRGEGTWQQLVTCPAPFAVPVPEWLDDCTAAQLYINPVTAWAVLTSELELMPGSTIVMNAAGSALGRLFAQLARLLGYRFIAVTSSPMQAQELLRLGAASVLQTVDEATLKEQMLELTNDAGADAAIDCIGGVAGHALAACLRPGADFLSLGLLSGESVNWQQLHHQLQLRGKLFHLRHWNQRIATEQWQAAFQRIIALLGSKQLELQQPAASFPLAEVREAIAYAEAGTKQLGKVMLTG